MLPAISVENLGKRYVIEHESRHDNLRDTLHHTARKLWRRVRWGTGFDREEFWALRDVSFTVQPGEVLGVIGRNGAGKSTLLKILSRITEPTQGKITLRGRVASLLEVGTGFHPDLTGRENIFLNGAILGMQRAEIRRKFDEIVAFAEIERFLDTPVKRYSSGMYVRLAFAVAAHLEPEILIVDEVLAVGDAAFQKKCLGKMQDVARGQGRTVLFVSHNLAALQALCSQALFLKSGQVVGLGSVNEQIDRYTIEHATGHGATFEPRPLTPRLILHDFSYSPTTVAPGIPFEFSIEFRSSIAVPLPEVCLVINSKLGQRIAIADLRKPGHTYRVTPSDPLVLRLRVPHLPLVEGEYLAGLYVASPEFRGDLLDLSLLSVQSAPAQHGLTPYAARDRGCLELSFAITSSDS